MDNFLKKFGKFNIIALLITALLFPTVLNYVKVVFLIGFLLSIFLLLSLNKERKRIFNHHVFILLYSIIGINLFFVLWGALNGANDEAVIESFYIYLLYPSFYALIIAYLPKLIEIKTLTAVLLSISIIISYIVIIHALRIVGIILPGYEFLYLLYPGLPSSIYDSAFTGQDGYVPRAVEHLIFLAPFSVALVVGKSHKSLKRFIIRANLLLVAMAIIISERRAMLVVFLLAVVTVFCRWLFVQPRRFVTVSLTGIGIAILTVVLFWWSSGTISFEFNELERGLTRLIDNYLSGTLAVRREQINVLLSSAGKSPLLGVGFGNSIPGYVRDLEHPWRFELTYVALIFQTGILGVICYATLFIRLVIIVKSSFNKSDNMILPYIFGLTGGLIAVSTNPYLNYGTGQWIIFLPLAAFNYVLLTTSKRLPVNHRFPNRERGSTV